MKKIFLILLVAVATISGCAQKGSKLHVKMDIKEVGDTIIVINDKMPDSLLTFTGKQGVFDFEVEVPEPNFIMLAEPGALRTDPSARYYRIPGVPGEEVVVTQAAGADSYDINGSGFYAQYHAADLAIKEAQKPYEAFQQKCEEMLKGGASPDSVLKVYQEGQTPLMEAFYNSVSEYIRTHAKEEASTAMIEHLMPDLDKMKAAVALLDPAVREGRCKPFYQNLIDLIEQRNRLEEETQKLQAAGRVAPDFTLNDINGKPLALSSLRGKYVILDFWGSWCGWCIKGFPEMKKYYKKYSGKFEILGIDCNDSEQKWKEAVKKHELPWLHVYNTNGSKVLGDYGIQGFPTKIIIDPEGKIVKTIVGEDPAFYTLLDELFK